MSSLAIIETHPIQYRAPVYRALATKFQIPLTVIYGSDFSVAGYHDKEFNKQFSWDTDLLSGYSHTFLSRVETGGGRDYDHVSANGLASVLAKLNPSAIMLPGYSPRFYQHAWFQALRRRKPVLFRGETAGQPQSSGSLRLGLRGGLLRAMYGACTRLLYIGKNSHDHFTSFGIPDSKLVFSPYCVDLTPFQTGEEARTRLRSETRAALGIGPGDLAFLFSGKLSTRKGPDLLIQAVRNLSKTRHEKLVVVFLGDGELAAPLKAESERDPRVEVRFAGFQNQSLLSPYFHAADLMVLPSRRMETWGLVVNEALHHGLPCVVSGAVGCAPDLIVPGETGEVCEPDSANSLTDALARSLALARSPEVRERCRARVALYSIDNAAAGIALAYTSAVSGRTSA